MLLCINTGKTHDDPNRMKIETQEFYLRSPDEMYAALPGHDEAVASAARIADRVEDYYASLDLGKRHFPVFQPPGEQTPEEYLRELCEQGLHERYGDHPPQAALDRLDHELGIINRMGFASYFLIVWDFVRFAREQRHPRYGPRLGLRGAGLLRCCYLSHVCPLKYDLLFERFLDPNRSEAPDIDIDFCKDRRGEVIDYVKDKYGEANVAQIGTFGTLAAKAAIRTSAACWTCPLVARRSGRQAWCPSSSASRSTRRSRRSPS